MLDKNETAPLLNFDRTSVRLLLGVSSRLGKYRGMVFAAAAGMKKKSKRFTESMIRQVVF